MKKVGLKRANMIRPGGKSLFEAIMAAITVGVDHVRPFSFDPTNIKVRRAHHPHQGNQEKARRRKQMERGLLTFHSYTYQAARRTA